MIVAVATATGMRKESRLTKRSDFEAVYARGRVWAHPLVVLRAVPGGELSRFGFVVSKRIGKAVIRNLVRRRLREAVRQMPVKGGWDIVLIARPTAREASFQELAGAARQLLARAGLLEALERKDSE